MESLLLLVSLPQEDTGHLLAEETPLCHLLAQRLTELYCLIPSSLDPADIHSYSGAQWRCVFAMKRWSVYTHFICGHVSYLPIVNIHPEDVLLVLQGSVHTGQDRGEPVVSWQWECPQVLLLFGLLQWAHQGSTKGLTKSLFCVDHLCAFVLVWKMSWIKFTLLSVRH